MYTAWLIIPTIFGTAFQIGYLAIWEFNHWTLFIYSIFLAVWITVVNERWKQRQNELAYLWDVHQYNETEPIRYEYSGSYTVDSMTHSITIENSLSTFQRRMIVITILP
jgi:small-conductance mechanosensitive channel